MKTWIWYTAILMGCFSGPWATGQEVDSVYLEEEVYWEEYDEEPVYSGILLGFDLDLAVPVLLTREQMSKNAWGINTQMLFQLDRSRPVFMGIGISGGQYDRESEEFTDFTEIEENLFRERTNAYLVHFDFKVRYFPGWNFSVFEPFIDISAGPRWSGATTGVYNLDYDENISFRFEESDWGLGYHLGLGSLISLGKEVRDVFGHFSVGYTGGQNSFLYLVKEDAANFDFTIDRFDRKSVPYNFLKLRLGITGYL
jgi:hypothetical protein